MKNVKNQAVSNSTLKDDDAMSRSPGVLIADDHGLFLTLLKLELEPRGFTVWLATDGEDALELFVQNRGKIDLVLLDVQMPGLDGPRTLSAIQRLDPDILACFMTGGTDAYTEDDLLERGAACVFNKPFRPAELVQRIQEVLESSPRKRDATCSQWIPTTLLIVPPAQPNTPKLVRSKARSSVSTTGPGS